MLCDMCHKNNSTVHLTEIIDNQVTELHLCEECARKKSAEMEQHFGLADLLAGLADFGKSVADVKGGEIVKCKNCGLTFEDFKKIGRLGCSECYSAFKSNLEPLLKRIHGSTHHIGKAPAGKAPGKMKVVTKAKAKIEAPELMQLKERLQKAIQLEEFEEAAKLRDKIRELEKKGKLE